MQAYERELVALLPRLRRFARALTREPADADDLVQVVIERALTRRGQWTPGTRLDSWVFTIMKRAFIDEGRARSRRAQVLGPADAGEQAIDSTAPGLDARLRARAIEAAMAELPDDQRLAVALVLVEGLSYREAAEVMETPEGTLTSRLVRGRQALAQALERQGVEL